MALPASNDIDHTHGYSSFNVILMVNYLPYNFILFFLRVCLFLKKKYMVNLLSIKFLKGSIKKTIL